MTRYLDCGRVTNCGDAAQHESRMPQHRSNTDITRVGLESMHFGKEKMFAVTTSRCGYSIFGNGVGIEKKLC